MGLSNRWFDSFARESSFAWARITIRRTSNNSPGSEGFITFPIEVTTSGSANFPGQSTHATRDMKTHAPTPYVASRTRAISTDTRFPRPSSTDWKVDRVNQRRVSRSRTVFSSCTALKAPRFLCFLGGVLVLAISGLAQSNARAQESPEADESIAVSDLRTRWFDEALNGEGYHSYPRPRMVRREWLNLNGPWEYRVTESTAERPKDYTGSILVPYPIESQLSGVRRSVAADEPASG